MPAERLEMAFAIYINMFQYYIMLYETVEPISRIFTNPQLYFEVQLLLTYPNVNYTGYGAHSAHTTVVRDCNHVFKIIISY